MKIMLKTEGVALLAAAVLAGGCSTVHSPSVKSLLMQEGKKLAAANQAAAQFTRETDLRVSALRDGVRSLNISLQQQQTSELTHALTYSANSNIASKQGRDAHAAAYLIGALYLAGEGGLEKKVNDQFQRDIDALRRQAVRIQHSWASLQALHEQVQAFAAGSGLASVDDRFVAAIAAEIPGASAEMDRVLKDAQRANDALDAALGLAPEPNQGLDQTRSRLRDWLDLLDRVHASSKIDSH